ncbi:MULTISPECIES: tRNA pseudouridine(38-40) synthase TruA [unclassified Candidatus Paralachnospira]|uniref:tRNA pseudouridine(38-40) synthase TruA n=1 Tax=unclassified Candidatus Paralachnospira TaxID=3099471 RepID=UPI003F903A40
MNYRIVVSYDGTRYNGWQKQKTTEDTIQGKLETLLSRMAGKEVTVQGSGRTDAGVHALAQTANFRMETELSEQELMDAINGYLPEDIAVLSLKTASERFHSRYNAIAKTYEYRLYIGNAKPVMDRKYVWQPEEKPDLERMRTAAAYVLGEHDFKSFCGNKKMKKPTVRRIDRIEVEEIPERQEAVLRFTGNGFLQNMVRILTGTLVECGQGKREPEQMREILEAKDRSAAGMTAPAKGLSLVRVDYQ